jgi:predicted  nucleic acid-binding Zn-ribbon protein
MNLILLNNIKNLIITLAIFSCALLNQAGASEIGSSIASINHQIKIYKKNLKIFNNIITKYTREAKAAKTEIEINFIDKQIPSIQQHRAKLEQQKKSLEQQIIAAKLTGNAYKLSLLNDLENLLEEIRTAKARVANISLINKNLPNKQPVITKEMLDTAIIKYLESKDQQFKELPITITAPKEDLNPIKSNTYVSVAALYAKTRLENDYGGNIFSKKMVPGINCAFGYRFDEFWGGEAGFEIEKLNKRSVNVPNGEKIFGVVVNQPTLIYSSYSSKINQHNIYIGVTSKYNIFNNNYFISILAGGALWHLKANTNLLGEQLYVGAGATNFAPRNITNEFYTTKLIPLIRIIFEYANTKKYGVRLFSTWKNTGNTEIKPDYSGNNYSIKFKSSLNTGLGFYYYL